jgi:hypothetical protein
MHPKSYFLLLQILWLSLAIPLVHEGVSLARLKDPGVSEKAIIQAWKDFRLKDGESAVKGGYPYMRCFEEASRKYNIPLALLLAVARGESNFDPDIESNKNCLGIMQIQWPGTARDLGITLKSDLLDPCINIDAGARYLSWLLERFKNDTYLAVAGYNYGPNAVSPGKVPDGARWYATYIHRHLQAVLSGPFQKTGRVLILEFTFYRSALDFAAYLKKAGGGLPFEIFKSRRYTYHVYLTYKTEAERNQFLQRLTKKTGIKPLTGG